jgi:hypothetical protein
MRIRGLIRRPRALQALTVAGSLVALFAASVPDDKHLVDWVEKRVRGLQPSRGERKIDQIGWADGILEAEQLARTHKRPVFLFTYDGRIETGRCWGGAFGLRAGPLSDPKVIKILNSSFVPVAAPNQDYVAAGGKASPAERTERGRIYGTFLEKKLGANDVHI